MVDQERIAALAANLQEFDAVLLVEEEDRCLCCLDRKQEGRAMIIKHSVFTEGKVHEFCGVLVCNHCRENINELFPMLATHIDLMAKKKVV